jgi:hypothetical protein
LQNFVSQTSTPLNTLIASAHPGQTVILWGTGLGPATGDETAGPLPGALPFLDNVYVGGLPASVRYAGRSGCCAGVDQIVFDIPSGVTGCYVPVAVQAGGVLSNFGTISVSASGSECDDPLSFRAADLAAFERNGVLRAGRAVLSRNAVFGSSSSALNLAAGFLAYKSQVLPQTLGPLNPALGSCYLSVTKIGADLSALPHGDGLDAGLAITLTGPAGPITASNTSAGAYAAPSSSGNLPAGTYQLTGTGGLNVGAFQATFTMPPALQWTNAGTFTGSTVSTGQPLTVTWTGGDSGGYVAIQLTSANAYYNSSIQCNAPTSPGAFTVPAYLMAAVLQSTGSLSVTSVSTPTRFTATGLDSGAITVTYLLQVPANFQAPPR